MQFTTATTLVAGVAKAHGERRLDEKLLALSKPKLLIVDELGYLPLEPDAASARFTTCLQAGVTIPGQPGEPPRVRPAQPGALAVPAPRQSLSAVPGAGTPMSGTQDDAARSSLLLEAPDALDYSLLGKVA